MTVERLRIPVRSQGLHEFTDQVQKVVASSGLSEELGDCLFALTGLARRLGVDPEAALRGANARFERRFRSAESEVHSSGRSPGEIDSDEWLELWRRAKAEERS